MPKNAFDKSRNRQKISLALRRGQIWLHYKHRWWQPELIIFSHGSRQVWPMLYLFYCGPAQLTTERFFKDAFDRAQAIAISLSKIRFLGIRISNPNLSKDSNPNPNPNPILKGINAPEIKFQHGALEQVLDWLVWKRNILLLLECTRVLRS